MMNEINEQTTDGAITSGLIMACLDEGTGPFDIRAVSLLKRLASVEAEGGLSAERLLELAPEIEAGLQQAELIARHSQEVTARCLALRPIPLSSPPLGF